MEVANRILRYLKTSPGGVWMRRNNHTKIVGYSEQIGQVVI